MISIKIATILRFRYTLTIFTVFCLLIWHPCIANPQQPIPKDQLTPESILALIHRHGLDTLAIKQQLKSITQTPYKESDASLVWAYYMLMADVYSIKHESPNATSDHYYKKALELSLNSSNKELEFLCYARQGHYYFIYRKISDALPLFLKANYLQPRTNLHKTPALSEHYRFIALFYNHIGNQQRALDYLKMALPFSLIYSRPRIDMLNSMGIFLQQLGKHTQALKVLQQALAEAQMGRDTAWVGIISGNLSEYKWKEGKKEEALQLLHENIVSSLQQNEKLDYMRSNLIAATYQIELKDWKKAEKHLKNALTILTNKPALLIHRVEVAKLLADIALLKGDVTTERKHLREYFILKQQLDKQTDNEEIIKIGWKLESEEYEKSLKDNESKQRSIQRVYSLIGLTILLIASIIILLLSRSKNIVKIKNIELSNAKLRLDMEKQAVDLELDTVKNALNNFTETIHQNNLVIAHLRKKLDDNNDNDQHIKSKVSEELNTMLKSHLMTHDRWVEFRRNFDIMHPQHLQQLKDRYPLITENDLRIIALTKLGLNNRSMAGLLGISTEGIKKAKQRLKKKISSYQENNE